MILVIDNYDSFVFTLAHYIFAAGGKPQVVRNDSLTVDDALAMKPEAVVLSPGPGRPETAGICIDLIQAAPPELPILGVCLGHQAIAAAFGGDIIQAPAIFHGKLSTIAHDGAGIFEGLPETFQVTRYHSLTIDPATLPDCLTVSATAEDGAIMAVSHRDRPVYGVQFHPESVASEHGHRMVSQFVQFAPMLAAL